MNTQPTGPIHSAISGNTADDPQHRVVFLHGLFGRGKNFTRITAGLAPEAQSLLVDLPNHGESGWTQNFEYEQMADLVAQHLRERFAASGPVDVIGHSMGGKVAMVLALRHPDLVRRLVVIDISPVGAESARGEFQHLLGSLTSINLDTLESRTAAHAELRSAIPEDSVRGFLLQNLKRGDDGFYWEPNLDMLYAQLDQVMGFPNMSSAQFTGPVLWIGGELSDYVSDHDEPAMRALFPNTARMTMLGAGHWVHSQKPAETIAALREFLFTETSETP